MVAWPVGLPYPRARGAGGSPNKGATRFETDAGPAKQRAVSTAVIDTLQLVYSCTAAQRDTLLNFHRGEGAQGGVWFDYINPFNGVAGQARFLVGQEPKQVPDPPKFDVSVVLEFLSNPEV